MFVVSSDWHADWVTDGYERINDVAAAAGEVVSYAIEHNAKAFFFLGDLSNPFSRNVHQAKALAMECAVRLTQAEIPNYWITGNHDVTDDNVGSHTLMDVAQLYSFGHTTVISKPGWFECDGYNILGLPYTPKTKPYNPEKVIDTLMSSHSAEHRRHDADKRRLMRTFVLGHLMIDGIEKGSESGQMARGRDVRYPVERIRESFPNAFMMNGHYHKRQCYEGITVPGALLRATHGEESNQPGFLVIP